MNRLLADMTAALPMILLWIGGTIMAAALLGRAIKRRRESLTGALKSHVTKTIGTLEPTPPSEHSPKPG